MANLISINLEGVSNTKCSVLATELESARRPVILVHGILDNLWRWITRQEASDLQLDLVDYRKPIPLFDPNPTSSGLAPIAFPELGLLCAFMHAGIPAVAFSYQDSLEPVASMKSALEKLHRVVKWTTERWNAPFVDLVGHSRGGLVCRHALIRDSAFLSAADFQSKIRSLTTICTPHLGSGIAAVAAPIQKAINRIKNLGALLPPSVKREWPLADNFHLMVENLAQLSPTSEEVIQVASANMPRLEGGYFAIAGTVPYYFKVTIPQLGSFRIPPSMSIPELTDGEGDTCVSIKSAFDIPLEGRTKKLTFPVNHLTACMHGDVHAAVLDWLADRAES